MPGWKMGGVVALLAGVLATTGAAAAGQGAKAAPEGKAPKGGSNKDEKAPATSSDDIEVRVLHASNAEGGIDPALANLPQLRKPPFSAYRTYKLARTVRKPLTKEGEKIALPNGRQLVVTLVEELPKGYFRVRAELGKGTSKTTLKLKVRRDRPVIVAGQKYQAGVLFLVLQVREHPTAAPKKKK